MIGYMEGAIKDFSLGIFDGPHATPKEAETGPIFLGIKNITPDGRLNLSEVRHISEEEFPKWTRRVIPQAGDIVFSYEATLHLYALIPEGFRGCLGRRLALIRPNPKSVDNRFLLFYFISPGWRKVVEGSIISGATVDRIPLIRFPHFPVRIPPIHVQRKIGDVLSAYDDLIENNLRRIALLEESARMLYKEWFLRLRFPGHKHTHIIGGFPEGWKKVTASDVMKILSGGTPKTSVADFWGGEIPFYTPKDAQKACYVLETEKTLTEEGLKNCNSKLYSKNTIFITARGTVGNLNLAQKPMAMNQSCYALKGKPPVSQFFLFCTLQETIDHFKHRAVGAVFDAIIVETFKLIPFVSPVPKLINLFEETVQPIFNQVENLLLQNQKLKQGRDWLLPRLMNGEIAV
jgi:type I restriction enzyme S subunit